MVEMSRTDYEATPRDDSGFHAVGRLPMHALRREPEIELDGEWEFQLLPSISSAPGDWKAVTVPSLWTMHEDADRPHYTNVPMPYDEVPPAIPGRNPAGVYRRTVELAPRAGRRTILHVGAAEGLLRAFVNGTPVGLSADSHLAAEFDITDAIVPGANRIELVVVKWSAVTYLEDQDHWWQSGLSRSVYLYTVPEVCLDDVVTVADYDPGTARGSLRVTASTTGLTHLHHNDYTIEVRAAGHTVTLPVTPRLPAPTLPKPSKDRSTRPDPLLPPDFLDLLSINAASAPIPPEFRAIPNAPTMNRDSTYGGPAGTAVAELTDLEVAPWSAERPHLEDVAVRLLDPDGETVDSTRLRVGFRRVRIEGRDLLVNGERILIQGVGRHDVHPHTGRVLDRERMLAELSLLKRFNINAIRTSHYPNDPAFLDLCDEIGFYVVDEADVEGHAFASTIPDDPRYLAPILERVTRLVARDRNHPCVIAWSLGNETGYGAAHDAAAAWVRRTDPTRPVHYEGAVSTDWHGGHAATDIVCPMYPAFASLEAYAADPRADRPFIACEYAYSQGNSTGGLAEYWERFEHLPGLQGGFLWGFLDHALDPDGDGRLRYGGDFGDEPNNGPTFLFGLAFGDLTPKPALYEARGLFSPVRVVSDADAARRGRLRLRNRQTFADLSAYTVELRVETQAGPVAHTPIATPELTAGTETAIELPGDVVREANSATALALTLTVRTRQDAVWAPAGTEIAVHQVTLPRPVPALPSAGTPASVDATGDLVHPVLARPPRVALWRAVTDNDLSISLNPRFVRSGFFALDRGDVAIDKAGDSTVVTTRYRAAFGDEILHRREIREVADGDYVLDEHLTLPDGTGDGLRVGMAFELAEGFEHASWVGLGPWENYPDRRASALLGRWESAIDDLAVPYLRPQENGTRGGVTAAELSGPAGRVRVESPLPLHLNVSRHTPDQLERADHWWELPESRATVVHLDVAHRGLGTALLGPDTRPSYRLHGERYTWRWRLTLPGTHDTDVQGAS